MYQIYIVDGAKEYSSTWAGYTLTGIRAKALELASAYLLTRDGTALTAASGLVWKPIQVDLESGGKRPH
jgi:hypothetical protein